MTTISGKVRQRHAHQHIGQRLALRRGRRDTLTGGLGNDTMQGGLGSDTYVFNPGDGQDTIFDNGAGSGEINTLRFGAAIAPAQVSVKESGSGDLVLSITGSTDKITLRSKLLSAAGGVDEVVFADGTVWHRTEQRAIASQERNGLCDDTGVPLICPTCQVFAQSTSVPATACYFAWGRFRYFRLGATLALA